MADHQRVSFSSVFQEFDKSSCFYSFERCDEFFSRIKGESPDVLGDRKFVTGSKRETWRSYMRKKTDRDKQGKKTLNDKNGNKKSCIEFQSRSASKEKEKEKDIFWTSSWSHQRKYRVRTKKGMYLENSWQDWHTSLFIPRETGPQVTCLCAFLVHERENVLWFRKSIIVKQETTDWTVTSLL